MMKVLAQIVLVYTLVMLGVHLVSSWILRRRWLSEVLLLRFEAAYYVLLMVYALLVRTRGLVIAAAVLATIHVAVWAVYEMKHPIPVGGHRSGLVAVQVFDWGESLVLAWILWICVHPH